MKNLKLKAARATKDLSQQALDKTLDELFWEE